MKIEISLSDNELDLLLEILEAKFDECFRDQEGDKAVVNLIKKIKKAVAK